MKIWAYVALATILIAAIGAGSKFLYDAGYTERDNEIKDELIEQQNAAIQKGIEDWIETQEAAEAEIIVEEKIVEKIRVVEKEVPKVVEKIVEVKPECRDLGSDVQRVFNDAIDAANRTVQVDAAAELVTALSSVRE